MGESTFQDNFVTLLVNLRRWEKERQQGGRTGGRGGCGLWKGFRTTSFCLKPLLQTAFAMQGSCAQVRGPSPRLARSTIAFEISCEKERYVRHCRHQGGLIVSTQSSSPGHTGHMAETRVAAHTSCSIEENIPFMCLCRLPRDCCALFIAVSCCDYPTSIYAENTDCTHCLQRSAAHGFCFLDFTKII